MQHHYAALLDLRARFGERLAIRVSFDHYAQEGHEKIRGTGSWEPAMEGMRWLAQNGFDLAVLRPTMVSPRVPSFCLRFSQSNIVQTSQSSSCLQVFPHAYGFASAGPAANPRAASAIKIFT
jgi:hypothetical protein